jgi:curved DNA-binding protein CbpA
LKKAFRRAIKANHPDLHPGNPDEQLARAAHPRC